MLLALTLAAAPLRFDPIAFFAGRTHGTGRLSVILHRARVVEVAGVGRPTADGIVLDQTVTPAGKPPTTRRWVLHAAAPGRYTGTLSDARGPVSVETTGARLHITYRGAGRVAFEQWLTLAPDGRSAANRLTAKRFGVVVARLDETIRKVD